MIGQPLRSMASGPIPEGQWNDCCHDARRVSAVCRHRPMTADLIFLLQAFVVVTIPFALSRALKLSGAVPLVVIQILLGIALGPSLFGRIAPDAYRLLFNPATLGPLTGTASIAVLFFSFITGLHVDTEIFRGGSRSFAAIAAASVAVPTLLGIVGGLVIGLRHPGELGEHA